jgi:hypothetical protein
MLQRPGRAIGLLEGSYSCVCDEERESAEELLSAARKLVAAWN